MPVVVSTACLAVPRELPAVLEAYALAQFDAVEVAPGHPPVRHLERGVPGLERVVALHEALPGEDAPWPANLSATDEDVRAASLARARRALSWCAAFGVPRFGFHPGFALETTVGADGPSGPPVSEARAIDQLLRSLDRLCGWADAEGVALDLEFMPGTAPGALVSTPEQALRVLSVIGAPHLGLLLDLAHVAIAAHRADRDPDEVVAALAPRVRAVHVSRPWPGKTDPDRHGAPDPDGWELDVLRRYPEWAELPVVVDARGLALGAVLEARDVVAAQLKPVAGPAGP